MKERLDIYMVKNGLTASRERAKELISKDGVLVNGVPAKKAGQQVLETDEIKLCIEEIPYVSRGGLKLEKAIYEFSLELSGKTAMDIGASTGGFTDCMLKCGMAKVYAVDVGTDQLHESLKCDSRVINLEKTNIRTLPDSEAESVDFISIDVSFISLSLVLPHALRFLKKNGQIVALIKPQFEAGKSALNKKGVVKDKKVHLSVIKSVIEFSENLNLFVSGLTYSPVRGPEGNIEYLIFLTKEKTDSPLVLPEQIVNDSHQTL